MEKPKHFSRHLSSRLLAIILDYFISHMNVVSLPISHVQTSNQSTNQSDCRRAQELVHYLWQRVLVGAKQISLLSHITSASHLSSIHKQTAFLEALNCVSNYSNGLISDINIIVISWWNLILSLLSVNININLKLR